MEPMLHTPRFACNNRPMPNVSIAQVAASDSSEIQIWLLVLAPLALGGLFSLVGVWLGSHLDRGARVEERQAAEYDGLRKDASEVIGTARVVLTAMAPSGYAAYAASPALNSEIDKRRHEADAIRPRLAALAVRWPKAALELNAVERHLGITPLRLTILVQRVTAPKDHFDDYLAELKDDHEAVIAALDRAIQKLSKEQRPTK